MNVEGVIVRVGDLGPVDFDEARAGLNEPAGQKQALAKRVLAIAFAHGRRFFGQVEGVAGSAGNDQAQRFAVILIQIVLGGGLFQVRHAGGDQVAELGAALQPHTRYFRSQLEVVHRDMVHLVHVHIVAGRVEVVGIVGSAQESRRAGLADHVAFLQRPRKHDERQHRHDGWLPVPRRQPRYGREVGLRPEPVGGRRA